RVDDLEEQLPLGAEVVMHQPPRDAGLGRNVGRRHRSVMPHPEQPTSGVEDLSTPLVVLETCVPAQSVSSGSWTAGLSRAPPGSSIASSSEPPSAPTPTGVGTFFGAMIVIWTSSSGLPPSAAGSASWSTITVEP